MRNIMLGLTLVGAVTLGVSAQAQPSTEGAMVQGVYWSGECGPRCQEHRWERHERWEARRRWWHHHRWEEQRYGYAYPRY